MGFAGVTGILAVAAVHAAFALAAPAAPTLTATTPASPANDNQPSVTGSAAAGSTVAIYTASGCTGAPIASGSAATFASPGIQVSVADDTTTTFYATATDGTGTS